VIDASAGRALTAVLAGPVQIAVRDPDGANANAERALLVARVHLDVRVLLDETVLLGATGHRLAKGRLPVARVLAVTSERAPTVRAATGATAGPPRVHASAGWWPRPHTATRHWRA
jgi:hypothetical protein